MKDRKALEIILYLIKSEEDIYDKQIEISVILKILNYCMNFKLIYNKYH